MNENRCNWVTDDEIYIRYHDEEWGIPTYDDRELFEMLVLESFQAGLSWITILKKRKNFKEAFDDFDVVKVANYDEDKIDELRNNEGIIRHKGKITSAINNAQIFIKIQKEFGSFSDYIWSFTEGEIIKAEYLTESELSKEISKDLKKRGMKFVGSVTVYSYLQAVGIIYSHDPQCYLYKEDQRISYEQ